MNKHHMYDEYGNPWGEATVKKPRPEGYVPSGSEKTAAWPGLPGKKQSRSRDSAGTPKVKTTMKEDY